MDRKMQRTRRKLRKRCPDTTGWQASLFLLFQQGTEHRARTLPFSLTSSAVPSSFSSCVMLGEVIPPPPLPHLTPLFSPDRLG